MNWLKTDFGLNNHVHTKTFATAGSGEQIADGLRTLADQLGKEPPANASCVVCLMLDDRPPPQTPISALRLSARSMNCLETANINTIEELTQRSMNDLLEIRNLGEYTIQKDIVERLAEKGLTLSATNFNHR